MLPRKPKWCPYLTAVAAALISHAAFADTRVFFIPGNYPDGQVIELTRNPDAGQFCRRNLTGLDQTRATLGLPTCQGRGGAGGEQPRLSARVDVLILIDDSQGLPRELPPRVPREALQQAGNRQVIRPTGVHGRNQDGTFGGRTLVVGESLARQGEAQQRIAQLAREFERGSLAGFGDEQREMSIPFQASFDGFRQSVMNELCRIMICRSDDRQRMTELVNRHRDLRDIHTNLQQSRTSERQPIRLSAVLTRQRDRQDRIADVRFAMGGERVEMEGERVPGRAPSQEEIVRRGVAEGLRLLRGRNEHWVQRMRCVLGILQHRSSDDAYFAWTRRMAQRGPEIPPSEWAQYVFSARDQIFLPRTGQRVPSGTELIGYMQLVDGQILQGIGWINRIIATHGGVTANAVRQMRDWIEQQQQNPNSINSCYREP